MNGKVIGLLKWAAIQKMTHTEYLTERILFLQYLIWVTFVTVLNFSIWSMNR